MRWTLVDNSIILRAEQGKIVLVSSLHLLWPIWFETIFYSR
jgi:hypothetical protein